MAKRKRRPLELDLFPFLSVLACTIGTLILMVVVISTSSLSKEQQSVQILARDTAQNDGKTPRYVECRGNGAVIHPQQTLVPLRDLENSTSLLAVFLNGVRARPSEYIIIAVRPDGFECFEQLRYQVEQAGIRIGYEPFNADWELCIPEPGRSRCD